VPEPGLVVFAYNFPHKKTQDVLVRLFLDGYRIAAILAADYKAINIPPGLRTRIRHVGLLHPSVIARRIGAEYIVVEHNGPEAAEILRSLKPDLGVISGARILKSDIISMFNIGIINFHPGLIPEVRGLDAMLWAILRDVPLGVTAHIIDKHIDAGKVLLRRAIPLCEDDTLLDISERLHETQLEVLGDAIRLALRGEGVEVHPVTSANRKMTRELELEVLRRFPAYVQRHCRSSTTSADVRGVRCRAGDASRDNGA